MLKRVIHSWDRKLSRRDNNRVIRPFEWGTESLDSPEFTDGSIGSGGDQRDAIFRFNERAILESDQFFSWDTAPAFRFEDGWLAFQSALRTPFAENNTAYARYFPVPGQAGTSNGSRANEVGRARGRAVVVLPHWNAKPQEHVPCASCSTALV